MRRSLVLVIALNALAPFALAQGFTSIGQDPPQVADLEGAWTIRVMTSGGFTGQGKGNLTLTSLGDLTCSLPGRACGAKLGLSALQPLTQLLAGADLSKWLALPAVSSLCSDCYTTTVVLARREGGLIRTFRFAWSDVTRAQAPAELVRMTDLAFSLATSTTVEPR